MSGEHWSTRLAKLYPHRETVEELLREARREERERVAEKFSGRDMPDACATADVADIVRSMPDPETVWPKVTP